MLFVQIGSRNYATGLFGPLFKNYLLIQTVLYRINSFISTKIVYNIVKREILVFKGDTYG
jgi:hypothetical protein